MNDLELQFLQFIETNKLFQKGDKLLLAFSGGVDSVVLATLLKKNNYNFSLVHCNFKLRGNESDNDEKFAIQFAQKYQLAIYHTSFDTKIFANQKKITIQEAARILRYNYFNEIAQQHSFDYILTAHHLDDNLETFFINLLRGTGLKGLTGMKIKQNKLIRPLLFVPKRQILEYANNEHLNWREDSSNKEDKYTRNYIRHHIIPLFLNMKPSFYQVFSQNIINLQNSFDLLNIFIKEKIQPFIKNKGSLTFIDIKELSKINYYDLLLWHFLREYKFNTDQIEQILYQKHTPGKCFISSSYKLYIDREKYIIKKNTDDLVKKEYTIKEFTQYITEPIPLSFEIIENFDIKNLPKTPNTAYLDYNKISFPLILRKWQYGDFFYPLGMNKPKKLSDFFTDIRLSVPEKEEVWLLCNSNDILWIINYRIDNRYKITDKTSKVLKIEHHV